MFLANVAIPTLIPHWILGIWALIPVIVVESLIIFGRHHVAFVDSLYASALANLRSTLLGIPLAWLMFVALSFPIAMGAQKLGGGSSTLTWIWTECLMLGARYKIAARTEFLASMALLLPYYVASVLMERRTLQRRLEGLSLAAATRTSVIMNLVSYGGLIVWFIYYYVHAPKA
jgi:hypothetical protein